MKASVVMKGMLRILAVAGAALTLALGAGCAHVTRYSIDSYDGPMPIEDYVYLERLR